MGMLVGDRQRRECVHAVAFSSHILIAVGGTVFEYQDLLTFGGDWVMLDLKLWTQHC